MRSRVRQKIKDEGLLEVRHAGGLLLLLQRDHRHVPETEPPDYVRARHG